MTPHVAQNDTRRRSAIGRRTARHDGYAISQRKRPLIEKVFGRLKPIGGLKKVKLRGLEKVGWLFRFEAGSRRPRSTSGGFRNWRPRRDPRAGFRAPRLRTNRPVTLSKGLNPRRSNLLDRLNGVRESLLQRGPSPRLGKSGAPPTGGLSRHPQGILSMARGFLRSRR